MVGVGNGERRGYEKNRGNLKKQKTTASQLRGPNKNPQTPYDITSIDEADCTKGC
jgi:hypothetical protein